MSTDYFAFAFSSAVIGGGLIGYLKAGSIASLAAGLGFGLGLLFSAFQVSANPRNFRVLLLLSLVLGTVMGSRFFKSGKFMPAGLIFTLCAVSVIRYGLRLL